MEIIFGFLFITFGAIGLVAGNPTAVAPILTCHHKDYTLVGTGCVKKEYVQPTTKCPKHGRFHEGKCIIHELIDGTMKCPKGYELAGKKCILNTFSPFIYECPSSHYSLVPHAHHESPTECVRETFTKARPSCPEGFHLSYDGVCFRQTYEKASVVCPKGYNPDKKGCFISEKVIPSFICPKQYTLQANGNCIKDKHEEKKCPHGYNQVNIGGKDECERVVVRDASPVCLHGEMDNKKNVCWSHEKEEPRFICKHKNATYINGKCIHVIEEEASLECSHGYKFDGKHCIKKTQTPAVFKCNKSETAKQTKCESVEKAALVGCQGLECMRDKVKQAVIKCPDGARMGDNGCEIVVRVDANKICENKGELRHNKCVFYEQKEPLVSCKQGGVPTNDGKCIERDIVSALVKCDKGFTLSDDSKGCAKTEHTHPSMVCPPNTAVKGGKCVIEKVEAAPIDCPHGFTYDIKGCLKIQEQDPILTCPKDLKLVNNACIPKHPEKVKNTKKAPCKKEAACPVQEHPNTATVYPANHEPMLPTSEGMMLPTSEGMMLPTSEGMMLPTSEGMMLPTSEGMMLPTSEGMMLPTSERMMLPTSEKMMLPTHEHPEPVSKYVHSDAIQTVEYVEQEPVLMQVEPEPTPTHATYNPEPMSMYPEALPSMNQHEEHQHMPAYEHQESTVLY